LKEEKAKLQGKKRKAEKLQRKTKKEEEFSWVSKA
jgi:hypothetical protein